MKPWGKFCFLVIAYGLILLHTFVPHQHANRTQGKVVIMHAGCTLPDGFGGLLERVFATDLGYGHLEDFNKSASIDLAVPLRSLLDEFVTVHIDVLSGTSKPSVPDCYIEKLKKKLILLSSGVFRAPPF